ncbi:MAG: putative sulfate exporter family transporter [Acidobacteriota bacterium]
MSSIQNPKSKIQNLFYVGLIFCLTPWASPPIALAIGLLFGLLLINPAPKRTKSLSKIMLQCSVVGLGFGMNLHQVIRAGSRGFIYTALGISATLLIGLGLARLLNVTPTSGYLISVGTAICGGSAIAAVGPVAGATEEEMSVSLGTVFILNSIALLTFPLIGRAVGLDPEQFGLWAALAIHDTSSVVGAAAKYGGTALAVGTTVKLARALWIVPVTLATAFFKRGGERGATTIQWPWFILFFCVAAVLNTYIEAGQPLFAVLRKVAVAGLTATLFLIGGGITRATLKKVGPRPLIQGVVLWLIVAVLSLFLIRSEWIAL